MPPPAIPRGLAPVSFAATVAVPPVTTCSVLVAIDPEPEAIVWPLVRKSRVVAATGELTVTVPADPLNTAVRSLVQVVAVTGDSVGDQRATVVFQVPLPPSVVPLPVQKRLTTGAATAAMPGDPVLLGVLGDE